MIKIALGKKFTVYLLNAVSKYGKIFKIKKNNVYLKETPMRILKRSFIFALVFTLIFTLFSCGKCEHKDENSDGICDKCDEKLEVAAGNVALIKDGVANFQFVMADGIGIAPIKKVDAIIKKLAKYEVDVKKVEDKENSIQEIEVLIGEVTSRGEKYQYDQHSLGIEGYLIKIVDSKILITAGSEETLSEAIERFGNEILGLADNPDELWEVIMTPEQAVEEIQSDYRVTALKINGTDIRGYTIAIDKSNSEHKRAAADLQKLLYERTGYWFEIVSLDEADKSIIIKHVNKEDTVPEGFRISANDQNQIVVECAFDNMLSNAFSDFIIAKIIGAEGEVDLSETYIKNISFLTYEQFGAVGDGVTNDYEAFYKTHEMANKAGQTVKATPGKKYLLEKPIAQNSLVSIQIKTNTVWTGAEFIIDDREIDTKTNRSWNRAVFEVQSDYNVEKIYNEELLKSILDAGLNRTTTKIDLGDGYNYKLMLVPYNLKHGIYRRKNYGSYAGTSMHEVIILDAEGNVDPSTPVMWDYTDLSSLSIYRIDGVTPITIEGGKFTTRASQLNCLSEVNGKLVLSQMYISRGIKITRPNTTVRNVEHYISDEAQYNEQYDENGNIIFVGNLYSAFYTAAGTANVLFENCVATGHRCYPRPNSVGGGTGGTYDVSGNTVANLTFKGCTQSNFWVTVDPETGHISACKEGTPGALPSMEYHPLMRSKYKRSHRMHWGIGGSNICKNLEYIDCTLSRYDAHEGVYNGKVIGSTVNAMALTGGGTMIIENTRTFTANANRVFTNREDYGSIWDGTVYLNNVSAYVDVAAFGNISVVERKYKANWFFGYQVVVPNIVINDLYFYDVKSYDGNTPYDPETSYAAVPNTTPIYLYDSKTVKADDKNHLPVTDTNSYYSYEDKDGDGYVDMPDIDCDGVYGNSTHKMPTAAEFKENGIDKTKGFKDASSYINFNVTRPPEYVKILSNKAGYKFYIPNTAKSGTISNGAQYDVDVRPEYNGQMGYYGIEENWKGYYGSTMFYYGPGENDYYEGPPSASEKITDDAAKGWYDWYVFY